MPTKNIHIRVTLESSAKTRLEEMAKRDCRSTANYIRVLIEKDQREKEST